MEGPYEWDETKRNLNLTKHALDFRDIVDLEWDTALFLPDRPKDYGEERYIAVGRLRGRVVIVVFSPKGEKLRIISLRKANERERRIYESKLEN